MNKMFTAVATLQLVEAHKLALDDPIGKHLRGYPNKRWRPRSPRHLLTHTGGTGDIFGPEFDEHRLQLREHRDYLKLHGSRGSPRSRAPALSIPTTASSCSAPSSNKSAGVLRRLRSRPRLSPGRHALHGVASGSPWSFRTGRSATCGLPLVVGGCRIPTRSPGGARRPVAATRPSATCCASPRRWTEADLGGDARRGDPPASAAVRLRL